ncbi:MAG TPA: integration host factor subunit alpha [Alphaproteobacteria bacterium]|nr:integration host factor subunit alpha [Alphaproteobacteria bacterium]
MKKKQQQQATLTRAVLSQAVFYQLGFSRVEAVRLVDDVFELITKSIAKGQDVKLSGFATFLIKSKKTRLGRNPKTGEAVSITPRKVLSFRPSALLKKQMNLI